MSYAWNWSVLLSPAPTGGGSYLGWVGSGLQLTLELSLVAALIALLAGIPVGVLRTLPNRSAKIFAGAWVELFRNVPLLVQLFFWYFVLPELLPAAPGNAIKQLPPLVQQFSAAAICLGLFTSARVAEQLRAGINALPAGQRAAGLALGLTLPQTYRHVLLPAAGRIVLPPLTSELLNLVKNSCVCSTIGLLELAAQGRQLVDYTAQPYEAFIVITATFMLINALLMALMHRLEGRVATPGTLAGGSR